MKAVVGLFTFAVLVACSDSESGTGEDACSGECVALLHFVGEAGVPAEADTLDVEVCHAESCASSTVDVPADTSIESFGTDPAATLVLTRTSAPVADDLRGVYEVHATWTSRTRRFAAGDLVSLRLSSASVENVVLRAKTLAAADVPECGCGTVDLDL